MEMFVICVIAQESLCMHKYGKYTKSKFHKDVWLYSVMGVYETLWVCLQ